MPSIKVQLYDENGKGVPGQLVNLVINGDMYAESYPYFYRMNVLGQSSKRLNKAFNGNWSATQIMNTNKKIFVPNFTDEKGQMIFKGANFD